LFWLTLGALLLFLLRLVLVVVDVLVRVIRIMAVVVAVAVLSIALWFIGFQLSSAAVRLIMRIKVKFYGCISQVL
jgi:hypothetical protein